MSFKLTQSWVFTNLVLFFYLGLSGCAAPAQRLDDLALHLGYQRQVVTGKPWQHLIYRNHSTRQTSQLRVYLEGDGSPWLSRYQIAADPTARNPLMLRLLQQDPNPAIYLGRPCYHDLPQSAPCPAQFWTSHRYSAQVIDSLVHALRHYLASTTYQKILLIGHSGGGTLAMLMAPKLPTQAVVTLAANLDITAWAHYHHYSPLTGSLNPAQQPALPTSIRQWHWAGAEDRNVPPVLIPAALRHQPQAEFRIVAGYTHHCCWETDWAEWLQLLPSD